MFYLFEAHAPGDMLAYPALCHNHCGKSHGSDLSPLEVWSQRALSKPPVDSIILWYVYGIWLPACMWLPWLRFAVVNNDIVQQWTISLNRHHSLGAWIIFFVTVIYYWSLVIANMEPLWQLTIASLEPLWTTKHLQFQPLSARNCARCTQRKWSLRCGVASALRVGENPGLQLVTSRGYIWAFLKKRFHCSRNRHILPDASGLASNIRNGHELVWCV